MKKLIILTAIVSSIALFSFSAPQGTHNTNVKVNENVEISQMQTNTSKDDAGSWILAWSDGISGILAWDDNFTE